MFNKAQKLIDQAQKIVVIQAENPDGDSLGSALALEEILGDLGKDVSLYCPVDIPKYLRYLTGWDRVEHDFDHQADLAIIVDTSADVLLGKVLDTPSVRSWLETHPVLVIDHHKTESTLSFEHTMLYMDAVSTAHVIHDLAQASDWPINAQAAAHMLASTLSDSLGLSTPNVTADTYRLAASLADLGASAATIEDRRREFMKKSPEILAYKGQLIDRVEYFLDGKLAVVQVPFEEIQQYSDAYNPGALIGDELRLVEGVDINCVIKTYPDGKITARLRSQSPVSEDIAAFFGGGGHPNAAGFRIYDQQDTVIHDLIEASDKALQQYASEAQA